jgi:hypothetical protein
MLTLDTASWRGSALSTRMTTVFGETRKFRVNRAVKRTGWYPVPLWMTPSTAGLHHTATSALIASCGA